MNHYSAPLLLRQRVAPSGDALRSVLAELHLFYRAASGLDSLLVGEVQILGQVRGALEAAVAAGAASPYVARLFREALPAARCVRATTGLGRGAASVCTAVVALTERELGQVAGRHALISLGPDTWPAWQPEHRPRQAPLPVVKGLFLKSRPPADRLSRKETA